MRAPPCRRSPPEIGSRSWRHRNCVGDASSCEFEQSDEHAPERADERLNEIGTLEVGVRRQHDRVGPDEIGFSRCCPRHCGGSASEQVHTDQ
jgi:hypothetical protein